MRIRWRGLELPSIVRPEKETLTPTYGKFVAEPFERGFGTTIGNSLRRILLSSLEGSAVTQLKIQRVQHEFTTIPGVVEDVTDIVLNVKSLVVKNHTDQTKVLRINRRNRGVVTGADIITDHTVEVINKDHIIATLTDDVPFEVEMVVANGRGYVPASEHTPSPEIGIIPIDAIFSPITRVRCEIEETRVGQKTNYDRLTMEIWTNGSVHPEMALVEAAKILRKHLNPFIQYAELGQQVRAEVHRSLPPTAPTEVNLEMPLAKAGFSDRARNCLEENGIRTLRDLVAKSQNELLQLPNLGKETLSGIEARLKELGLRLGMSLPQTEHV
ncbi:MAG: DNA-directed RNA polymerase subunit alpha [Pirellulales bacterium]|nr:DNA-directed RNA polymerase subunit alpha [Pirellulales bacterium]